ncbi:MAG: DUF924 family protein [Alphaproteobacteria bacterium]
MDWSEVYGFWFGEPGTESHGDVREFWFGGGSEVDEEIVRRFAGLYSGAAAGRFDHWAADPHGALSLILLLDQFPRNMFRGDARSFATDHLALANAKRLVGGPGHNDLISVEKLFAYLPFEHSEDIGDQVRSVALFEALEPHEEKQDWVDFAVEHRDIIERFGRFPHRNAILGRENTSEEEIWLRQSDQRFGTVVEDDAGQ